MESRENAGILLIDGIRATMARDKRIWCECVCMCVMGII